LQHLIQPLAVALGSAVGSILRQTAETHHAAFWRSTSAPIRLSVTGAGSLLAGFLAAFTSPLDASYTLIPQSLGNDLLGGFFVGLLGGFLILPALVFVHAGGAPGEAQSRRMILELLGALAISIVFFLLGAALCRTALAMT
jgi:fluoride ion exporter CrcB/FEX